MRRDACSVWLVVRWCTLLAVATFFQWFSSRPRAFADEPQSLHAAIDARLFQLSGITLSRCSDSEFLRRVSLDLNGMPPTADQLRNFLSDPSPDKRMAIVDQLLESPHYARHMAATFDLFLMERRANTHVSADEWQAWLVDAFRTNRPWDDLAQAMLSADGDEATLRPAARFWLDRSVEPHLMTRDIGRIFFGRDLQCAQCHDHPLVEDYTQADYQGLLAFVNTSYPQVIKAGESERTVVGEKAGTDVAFESVFLGVPRRTGPRLPTDLAMDEPFLLPGQEYVVAPADNTKSVPVFSRRRHLAELTTNGSNAAFNENIVNRLWCSLLGRGLIHPIDFHHADNPAFDAELLKLLADHFADTHYDVKALIRELTLTAVYQRPFAAPGFLFEQASTAAKLYEELPGQLQAAERAAASAQQQYLTATDSWQTAEGLTLPVATELDAKRQAYAEACKQHTEATQAQSAAEQAVASRQTQIAAFEQALSALEPALLAAPADQELVDISQKLKSKQETGSSELPALTKVVEEAVANVQTKQAAVDSLRQEITTVRERLAPLLAAAREAEAAMLSARQHASREKQSAARIQQRMKLAHAWVELPKQKQTLDDLHQQRSTVMQEHAACDEQWQRIGQAIDAQRNAMSVLTAAQQSTQADLEMAKSQLATREREHESMMHVTEALKKAQSLIANERAIARAASELTSVTSACELRLQQAQQAVNESQARCESADLAVSSGKQRLEELEQQRSSLEMTQTTHRDEMARLEQEMSNCHASIEQAEDQLINHWTEHFLLSSQKPLTPEQLCWSIFRVTGVYQQYWNVEVVELDKTQPLSEEQRADPAVMSQRESEIEQRVYDKLKGNLASFVAMYGAAAGQPQSDFFATADQALFAANGGDINAWISPSGDNVTQRMIAASDPRLAAEELYLAILSRMPVDAEVEQVQIWLSERQADKPVAVQELVWAALNSAEFRFNH